MNTTYGKTSGDDRRLADVVKKRFQSLKEDRSPWEDHWRDLAQYILPRRARWLNRDDSAGKTSHKVVDGTGTTAFRLLASGMMTGITSPSRIWFRQVTEDHDLMEEASVKLWLSIVQNREMQVFQASNIYKTMHSCYEDIGVFGTAAAMIVRDFHMVIRGQSMPVGTFWLATNQYGEVDTLYRLISMDVGKVVKEFGLENVCPSTRTAYDRGDYHSKVDVYQCIEPNNGRDTSRSDFAGKRWRSVYWEAPSRDGEFVAKRGYDYKPFIAPRWNATALEAYGISPGMDALPDIKQLQFMQHQMAITVEKQNDPPIQGPSSIGDVKGMTNSGQFTPIENFDGTSQAIRSIYDVNLNVGDLREMIRECQGRINETSFANLFMMFNQMEGVQPRNQLEIAERRGEKMLALGPVLEGLQHEMIEPIVDAGFDAILDAGLVPPPPPELQGQQLGVQLQSMLAREQRGDEIMAIDRILGLTGNISAVYPGIIDKVDMDQALDEYSRLLGGPPSIIRTDKDVDAIRQGRAQQEQQVQAMEMANSGAQAAKTLSEADTESASALSAIFGAQQGGMI